MPNETEKLVEKFLEKIKKNLPEWIKSNEDKVEDIILEIRSHIWDSAYEIAGSDDPDTISIQKAINRIGNPKEIAQSYKTRGTPKYFISEELWPNYMKFIYFIIAFVTTILFILQIVIFEPNNLIQAILNTITLSYTSISFFIIIVTILFFYFSTEGYFPEDFDSKSSSKQKIKESEYYKPGEFLMGGTFSILFGLLFIILPVDMLNLFRVIVVWLIQIFDSNTLVTSEYVSISIELQIWFTLVGVLGIITGIIQLMKIPRKDLDYHLGMNFFYIITRIGDIALTIYLILNLHLILEVIPLSYTTLLILTFLGIISSISDIAKAIRKSIKIFNLFEEKNNALAV